MAAPDVGGFLLLAAWFVPQPEIATAMTLAAIAAVFISSGY